MPSRRPILGLALLPLVARVSAQTEAPQEGKHFKVLKSPRPVADGGKVEVLEFFSYACPHCYAFEPSLEKWRSGLPADVAFKRVPVPFLNNAANFQRAYFALEILGQVNAAHARIFDAVHRDHKALGSAEAIAEIVAPAGVDTTRFLNAFRSFGMAPLIARAKAATSEYEIDGVPALAVGGLGLTSPAQAGGMPQALATADFLIARARKG